MGTLRQLEQSAQRAPRFDKELSVQFGMPRRGQVDGHR